MNERPFGVTFSDADDAHITPNMLVTGKPHHPLVTPSTAILSNMPCDKMWLERKRTLAHFWKKWQADYLTTLSIDKKWLGDNTMIKPGDVVILRPETLEKNQWRLARIVDIHKNPDGIATTASVRLPNRTVLTRTLRQLALLEPAAVELERQVAVKDQSPVIRVPQGRGMRNDLEHVEGDSLGASDSRERIRSRSLSRPYPTEGEPMMVYEHPGDVVATPTEPVSSHSEESATPAQSSSDSTRVTRTRHRKGFYRKLNDGL